MAQRSSMKRKGKTLMNVQLNDDDEIAVVLVEKPERSVKREGGHGYDNDDDDDDNVDDDDDEESSENLDSDPELVQTKDGRLMLDLKRNKSCPKCKKPMKTVAEMEAHKPKCPGTMDKVTDVILKEMKAAKHANPSDEFHKYCNPNPEDPCYCCGEDVSTAHVGHIRCQFCPKSFKAYDYLDRHIRSVHSESDDYPCSFCNAKCPTAEIFKEHQKTHSEGKPFACTTCGKEFTRRYHLDRHVKHSNCGSDEKNMLPCEVCGKEFTRVDNLREHLRTHLGQAGRKRDYQCPYCPKSFYGSSLLNIHIRTHTGEKPFPCDLCPKSFPSSGALRKHRRKHTGERPYRCDECSATFAARETLNRHRKTHTGVKPHECKECGKRFIQATQLRTHMYMHTGTAGYPCKECGKAFARSSKLNEHVKYEHRGEKPFECSECGKHFLDRNELIRHMAVHKTKKEFQCPCGNSYVRKASLKVHMKTHAVEDPVNCTVCNNTFIRMDCLLRHMRKKHPEAIEELIESTEKRKQEERLPLKAATVEINGEVFEITSMGETAKEPVFVLPDRERDDELAEDSVKVLDVVELPMITTTRSCETNAEAALTYPLLPITEETEVLIDDEVTFQEASVVESSCAESDSDEKKYPADVEDVPATIIPTSSKHQTDGIAAIFKIVKSKPKSVSSAPANEAAIPEISPSVPRKRSSVPSKKESNVMPPNVSGKASPVYRKQSKATATPIPQVKETKPRSPRTTRAVETVKKESTSVPVKRRTPRESKPVGAKRRRPDDDSIPIFLSDDMLAEKISELLLMLVGEEMLREFGWPETPVEDVLSKVILRCGHRPTKGEEAGDKTTRMRENTKILFSATMEDDEIKPLLNNHTIDEVIVSLLKSK